MKTQLNEQRTKVFLDRYARKGSDGLPVETAPEQMWQRVADVIGTDEFQRARFSELLQGFKFVPGGRILSGAGTESEVTFYNCYVIPVETKQRRLLRAMKATEVELQRNPDRGCDSREAIFDTMGTMVDIMSRGGGVGINWSVLRPKGAYLRRINGTTSGPVSWMDVASRAVGVVEQGGSRRGAAMFMLDDWHPDLMEFIKAKENLSVITNANVSIAVSDEFMSTLGRDGDWTFQFPDTADGRYDSEWTGDLAGWKESGGRVVDYGTMPAREIWRALAESAWASGEPGVVFLGRYNALSTGAGIERIISVNPCGEQGLGAYSVCNLGAMNLAAYVVTQEGSPPYFHWSDFSSDVGTAVEFLDRVIDENFYFIPENEEIQMRLRRIGLGVMGLADALILLGLRYGSPDAVEFTEAVFSDMKHAAIAKSTALAGDLGAAPAWRFGETEFQPYLDDDDIDPHLWAEVQRLGMRNMFLLTQAPTGTTSILAGVNSGIEPYFAFSYTRKDRTGEHRVLAPVLEKIGYDGSWSADFLVTSNDVTVEEHIAMQAAAQKYIDSSVSKTINGPNSHTVEDVEKAYTLAYNSGLKGLAYFRDGSGRDQVLYKDTPVPAATSELEDLHQQVEALHELLPYATDFTRPETLAGATHRVSTRAGTAYVTINRDGDGRAVEVFFNVGKAGSDVAAMAESLGRLGSLALRHGANLGGLANQLEGVGGASQFNKAIPHAIGEALSKENRPTKVGIQVPTVAVANMVLPSEIGVAYPLSVGMDICPACDNISLVREEGCAKCLSCGHSQC